MPKKTGIREIPALEAKQTEKQTMYFLYISILKTV